ncbi:MAG: alanine--tRNA ligase [Chloroflexi bacterium]|nr:alanine--tRNA ligase [Chloroflexota bacterium]
MKRLTSAEIRSSFLKFFEEKGHTIVPSSSLIPANDPTLLFTNAGMVQFKDVFLGLEKRPYTRATSCQKCMRVSGKHNDLENVGPSPRHHTFFEMLGNFSFGDYFKREAIHYAWELLTQVWEIPPERLHVTVYKDDDEAYRVWREEIGLPEERIHRMGEETNFWAMGETGPCGPTSEIIYDQGPQACTCGDPNCSIELDNGCDRWLEIWNLVFMQYNQFPDGHREPLPQHGVDTGMGLERIAAVLQQVPSNYDTDIFTGIMDHIQRLLGHTDEERQEHYVGYRVIADHGRAATFLIGDGVIPGNEGRNYVLRMIIRRAARFGRKIGFTDPFLAHIADKVIEIMGDVYPEIVERADFIKRTLTAEEERFYQTLDAGMAQLERIIEELKAKGERIIPGDIAFRLYDTHGFPLEMTRDVAREHGMEVDEVGFQKALEEQRRRSREKAQFKKVDQSQAARYKALLDHLIATGKLPPEGVRHRIYDDTLETETEVVALLVGDELRDQVEPGQKVRVILRETPFYVESGGQVSDTGIIEHIPQNGGDMWRIRVTGMEKPAEGLIVHVGEVVTGRPKVGDTARARVDAERRWNIMRNHTATHILHYFLRQTLGSHVHQAGSLVAPDRLRFDYTETVPPSPETLARIEAAINKALMRDDLVWDEWTSYQEALQQGAMALFGEKYGETVRVVNIARPQPYSKELCGGTHVHHTGQIGFFRIIAEGSVGSGSRRIEAVTGERAAELVTERLNELERLAQLLRVPPEQVETRVRHLLGELSDLEREVRALKEEQAKQLAWRLAEEAQLVEGIPVVAARVDVDDPELLRRMTDWIRDRLGTGVVVLGTVRNGRPQFVAAVTKDLAERGLHAGRIVRQVAQIVGGGGGGSPTLAQAGGRDASKLDLALATVGEVIKQHG